MGTTAPSRSRGKGELCWGLSLLPNLRCLHQLVVARPFPQLAMLGLTIAMPSKALSSRRAPQSSVACRIVCTARQQHQPSSDNSGALAAAATILRTLETATLVLAAGAHWGAAASAHKVVAEAALGPTSDRGKRSRLDHASFAASTPALLAPVLDAPVPDWLPTGGLWLTLPLLIAFVVGRLAALLDLRRTATLRIAEGAAARLLHTDALLRQQGEALALLSRQVDKATMRSRLSSRDLRPPIKQLEATSAEQAALLSALVQRVDAAEHGVRVGVARGAQE